MKTTWTPGPQKGMNALGVKPKATIAGDYKAGPLSKVTTNLGTLGAKVPPQLKPSNNPGPMTAPSSQGPTQPKAK
jgi:hypothetical protein